MSLMSFIARRLQDEGLLAEGPRRIFLRERFGFQLVPAGAQEVDQILVIAESDWAANAARGWVDRYSQATELTPEQRADMYDWTRVKYAASLVKASSRATNEALQRLKSARMPHPGRPPSGTRPPRRRRETPPEEEAAAPPTPPSVPAPPISPSVPPLTVEKVKSILPPHPQRAHIPSVVSDAKRMGIPEDAAKAAIEHMVQTGQVDRKGDFIKRKSPQ